MNHQFQTNEIKQKLNEIQDEDGNIKKRLIVGTPEVFMRQHDIMYEITFRVLIEIASCLLKHIG